jgi:cardiolipin synthase
MSFGNLKAAFEYTLRNKVKLVRGGKDYFETLLKLIDQSKDNIHLQTYIYEDDKTGRHVADALKAAAKRGVAVYLLADGYASQQMSQKFIDELKASGIHFRFFEPLFKSKYFYFGRRLHHKIIVIDGLYAMVGGVNITDRYNDMPGKPAWLDFALYVEGEIALELCVLCWKTWNGFPRRMGLTPCELNQPDYSYLPKEVMVRMRRNDWVRKKNQVSQSYLELFNKAQSYVLILCSYFLPGKDVCRQIEKAIERGVKVMIIIAGPSDVMLAKNAERFMYDWLLRKGVEIFEYQKNVLHGKIALCDDKWMTVGSYNVNNISAYVSIELNLDVNNPTVTTETREMLEQIIARDCIPITAIRHNQSKNIFKQFGRWASYQLIRIVIYLTTFYFKQHAY